MEVQVKHNSEIINGTDARSCFIYGETTLKVAHYLIENNSGVGFRNYPSDEDKFPQENVFFVLRGKVEVVIEDKRYVLEQYDSIRVIGYGSFSIWGLVETSSVISLTASAQDMSDNEEGLTGLVNKSEANDPYTRNHGSRVGRLAGKVANYVIPFGDIREIVTAGAFHDIGKSEISPDILNKPGKLTDEEYDIIKKHPVYSYEAVKDTLDEDVSEMIRHHHEFLDGSGYPDHLQGDQININVRILTVCDIFDALTSNRVYRNKYSAEEALGILEGMKGKLDPKVVDAMKTLVDNRTINYSESQNGYC